MKIQPINSNYLASNSNVSFDARVWDMKKLDVLKKTPAEIRTIAEYFHKSSESELHEITGSHWFRRNDLKAYNILKSTIDFVNVLKDNWRLSLAALLTAESIRELDESEKLSKQELVSKIEDLENKYASRDQEYQYEKDSSSPFTEAYFNREMSEFP